MRLNVNTPITNNIGFTKIPIIWIHNRNHLKIGLTQISAHFKFGLTQTPAYFIIGLTQVPAHFKIGLTQIPAHLNLYLHFIKRADEDPIRCSFYFRQQAVLRRTFLTRLQWHSLQTDIVAYIIQVYIIVNTSSHGIMNITWLWIGLYSQNFYQNQRVLHRSIYIELVLTSREECNAFADPFFRIYLCLSRNFCQLACSFAAWFTLRQP